MLPDDLTGAPLSSTTDINAFNDRELTYVPLIFNSLSLPLHDRFTCADARAAHALLWRPLNSHEVDS